VTKITIQSYKFNVVILIAVYVINYAIDQKRIVFAFILAIFVAEKNMI